MRYGLIPAQWPERASLGALLAAVLALVVGGSILAALAFLVCALMGWTRVFDENRATGKPTLTNRQRAVVGSVLAAIGLMVVAQKAGRASSGEGSNGGVPVSIATMPRADALRAMEAKITALAVRPLERENDTAGYTRLGSQTWARANEYRRWAALAAAQSDNCDKVNALAVWEGATKSDLSWNVTCANGERFRINEAQARSIKAQFDPAATVEEREKYAALIEVARPLSAAFKDFDAGNAEVACDDMLRQASVDRNSFQSSGTSQVERDEEAGHVIIARDYESNNAMGGTISGRYECTVDVAANRIVSLRTQDAFGVRAIYQRDD